MKLAVIALLAGLTVTFVYLERRASLCGAGLIEPDLPYGLRADWFNGMFWLTDSDGWGVIAPPVELEVNDGVVIDVRRVQRYTLDHGFVADLVLVSGDRVLLSLEGSSENALRPRVLPPNEPLADASWVDVRSCFPGTWSGIVRWAGWKLYGWLK